MKKLENNPATIAVLCIVLVGAVAIMALRVKGAKVKAASLTTAPVTQSGQVEKDLSRAQIIGKGPVRISRDPFYHELLFARSDTANGSGGQEETQSAGEAPGGLPPITISGLIPAERNSPQQIDQEAIDGTEPEQTAPEPALRLSAILSGPPAIAIITDTNGKTRTVREGDKLGEDCIVSKIADDTVTIQYGGKTVTFKLWEGLKTDEDTERNTQDNGRALRHSSDLSADTCCSRRAPV